MTLRRGRHGPRRGLRQGPGTETVRPRASTVKTRRRIAVGLVVYDLPDIHSPMRRQMLGVACAGGSNFTECP